MKSIAGLAALVVALGMAMAPSAVAADYPSRPVTIVVPWPTGHATDIAARLLARELEILLGQPFVVENRPGAGGSIGTAIAAKSAPDGYTLLAASSGPMSVLPSLQSVSYDPVKDLVMVGVISRSPYVLVVSPSFPAANAGELVALLRAKPDRYSFGPSGTDATGQVVAELFNSLAGISARHVADKGAGPVLVDVTDGRVDYGFEVAAAIAEDVRAGRVKALGVSTTRRSPALPHVPTIARSAGLPDFDAGVWIGLAAPAHVPAAVIERLSHALEKAMDSAELRRRLLAAGLDPVESTPEELSAFVREERDQYAEVIRKAHITLD